MNYLDELLGGYAPLAINAAQALAFLVIGYIVSGFVYRMIRRRVLKSELIDDTLGTFFASIARYTILIVVIIAVLQIFGFQATSLVAVLGAASLAIGLALQGTLTDMAAGVMLIIFRPYRLDDYVDIGGTTGTVTDLNIFTTELVTPNNIRIIVPNSKSWGSIITNFSSNKTRRLDLTFNIDYNDDADKAMALIREYLESDERAHKEPEPWVKVTALGASSVDIGVRVWCDSSDIWNLKFESLKAIKEIFDREGITIPYPHQVLVQK